MIIGNRPPPKCRTREMNARATTRRVDSSNDWWNGYCEETWSRITVMPHLTHLSFRISYAPNSLCHDILVECKSLKFLTTARGGEDYWMRAEASVEKRRRSGDWKGENRVKWIQCNGFSHSKDNDPDPKT
ncbi:hypothetical protein B0H19DRAFT_1057215 [Mycena capillaripes]|nr:hypothetical protein B0H19DRAFT_1057215 [Mycena capillaripes]